MTESSAWNSFKKCFEQHIYFSEKSSASIFNILVLRVLTRKLPKEEKDKFNPVSEKKPS